MPRMLLPEIRAVVAGWAATEPLIRRVYLFGSRARGAERPDSDIDLALLTDPDPDARAATSDPFTLANGTWADWRERWEAGLQAVLPLPLHLHQVTRWDWRVLRPALRQSRVCLYRRGMSEP